MIQFGNKISKGKNKGKTRRCWKPNVRRKMMWSDALQKNLFIKVTRRSLRTIQKSGGLDKYLLNDKPSRIKELGIFGWYLRWQVMKSPKVQKEMKDERERLGIPKPPNFKEWLRMRNSKRELKKRLDEHINITDETEPFYNRSLH